MLRFLEGFKHLFAAVVSYCDSDIGPRARGLQNPEALARETICMYRSGLLLILPCFMFPIHRVFVLLFSGA